MNSKQIFWPRATAASGNILNPNKPATLVLDTLQLTSFFLFWQNIISLTDCNR